MSRKIFMLFAAMLFLLTGTVFGAALELVPASAVYQMSFDLERIAALPAVKQSFGADKNDVTDALKAAGCSRITLAGGETWAVVLADFTCSQEALLALLAANGVKTEKVTVAGKNCYRADHWQLGNIPAMEKPLFSFIAPNTVAVMEQKRAAGVFDALKQTQTIRPGKEILWCSAVPRRVSARKIPPLREVMKMFRNCRFLTLKLDLTGENQDSVFAELGAVCKNADAANFSAFMLPAGMVMALNYLCSADAELCNQLAGMVEPEVSGNTAYARLKLTPELSRRFAEAMRKTAQEQLANSAVQRK
ncbi:MAG: hypothetical protein IJZ19_04790 [Lentisphaeria bacterium]|nr:hypothetical protein [Lentisphaeria bacterium]MBQ8754324.1 hypothetical protein [Lentisphaeria bacterium]